MTIAVSWASNTEEMVHLVVAVKPCGEVLQQALTGE